MMLAMIGDAQTWQTPWENYRDAVTVAQSYDGPIYSNRPIGAAGFLWYDDTTEATEEVSTLCEQTEPFALIDFPFRPQDLPPCIRQLAIETIDVAQRHGSGPIHILVIPRRS